MDLFLKHRLDKQLSLYLDCNDCGFVDMMYSEQASKQAQSVISGQARMLLMQLDEQRLSVILTEVQN